MTYQEAFGEPAAPTAEALADAFLSEYAQTWTGVTWSPRRVRDVVAAIIAAARADERTRLAEPVIWCLCGDGLRTLRDMAEHLSAIHDVDICGEAHP